MTTTAFNSVARWAPTAATGWVVAAAVAGNAIEFYDFFAYTVFLAPIGRAFFPTGDAWTSLLASAAAFGVGFLARPLGAIAIGAYADHVGRRPAMLISIVLITLGSLGLAATPSYAAIGVAAPAAVVAARLVQGFALGGEIGPIGAFLIEIAPAERRGLYASWQSASQAIAGLAAGGVAAALSIALSATALEAWGWRVVFALSIVLGPLALYLRRAMPETLRRGPSALRFEPGLGAFAGAIALATLVVIGGTVATYVAFFMTTYGVSTLRMPASSALVATVVGAVVGLIAALLAGWLSDAIGRRPVMLAARIALTLAGWPLFLWLEVEPTRDTLYAVAAVIAALAALAAAPSFAAIPELLPRRLRASGLGIVYAIGVALFGGATQFVVAYLIGAFHDPTAPGWCVTATAALSAVAVWALPETRQRGLDDAPPAR